VRLVWLIARKYFFSRKNPSAINVITAISLTGYAIGALALIVLLSALNGFETAIFGGYFNGDADLKVVAKQGKVFTLSEAQLQKISKLPGFVAYYQCLEDKAIVKLNDKQTVALVKGVDSGIYKTLIIDSLVVTGSKVLQKQPQLDPALGQIPEELDILNFTWLSEGIVYKLNVGTENTKLELLVPDRSSSSVSQSVLNQEDVYVAGMVKLGEDLNESTIIVPLGVAKSLFGRENEISSLNLKVKNGDIESVKRKIQSIVGQSFEVLDRREQHKTMYKMFNTEKWVSFALLAFILMLISFNLFGSIRMMIIDKKQDLKMLNSLGMHNFSIRSVFLLEGQLVSLVGTTLGIMIGTILVLLQQEYGFVKTQSTFAMAYPVKLVLTDILLVFGLNTVLAGLSSWFASIRKFKV
jgi:ABC-type lipoprotein release transport system permease subunit